MLELSERQERIRRLLSIKGRLSVGQLAAQMCVTAMTIRRDLDAMQQAGLLTRTHGGCVFQSPFAVELSFPEKQRLRQAQKTAIARETVRLLKRGETIYLDTGTTALQVACLLPPNLGLRVFTNNLRIALVLFARVGVEVVVYGGTLARHNPDLVDEIAVSQISQYRVDVAIVGGDALDVARGEFYGADLGTALLSRTAQQQANRVILAMDSSKFAKRSIAVAGKLTEGMTLVTDDEVTPKDRAALQKTEAKIIFSRTTRNGESL